MSFVGELDAALETPHPDDAAERVHLLVANVLHRLDPGADIKRTQYFTHTIVPDLVLRWGPSESRRERHVHLRFNVSNEAFGQDLDLLGGESPLFIGMTDRGDLREPAWSTMAQSAANGSLITQSQAIASFDGQARLEARTRKATGALVRVGRGLIDEPEAERLGTNYRGALAAITELAAANDVARDAVELALALLEDYLPEEGELEVERALQSEWIRSGGDPYDFPSSTPWNAELLDVPTLREVLISLLSSPQPVPPETWQRNAGFVRVEDLGRVLGRDMRGGKFDAMARALLPNWTAKWVWTERQSTLALFETYEWLIENGVVGLEANDLKTFFADDGRHFKDKEGGNPLPLLREARQMLSQPGLQQVGLLGPMEGIRYEPLSSAGEVFTRIQKILAGPGASSYRVHSVVAVVPSADAIANIDLDRHRIDLNGHSTPVATLARMATRFFSRASRPEGLDHFLATGERPPGSLGEGLGRAGGW